ncbi:chaperonin containing t-complex protein 1, gamma subunit, putative [Theileria equi strain WA]|uniref:T-complex protein 1 subunit gamma n=1 Tax=Theileria equi strain WA TaxID=1537102 RepID=L0B080_THEEQ|nr:chaperonin containing t-complex protein 1, gamma subunit, putative [Theileria equi strain WA]AFZ80883.1 chaperonin containing t-complex protein 1, gamma subunit, putative [Theileria equi strain WA]|eukprot:XP_004830549.1 chaperonin containing t-complex protein 1, gamma subunit, putative [Theileria equi strain WA]
MMQQQPTVLVFKPTVRKESDRKAQLATIQASKALSEIVRTTLGPRSMLKMLLDPMGGIVITNDGNSILREIDVANPAAKSLIELSRSQDEEVGDGTTSCVILCGQFLANAEPLLTREIHPTVIVSGYMEALEDALAVLEDISVKIDLNDREGVKSVIESCLETKFSSRWGPLVSELALQAVTKVKVTGADGRNTIDVKRYAKVEKIPGGFLEDSCVLDGVIIAKDVTHAKMARRIENPRVLILDCTLEYKKGESQTIVDITDEAGWTKLLEQEEQEVQKMCQNIISTGCNVVVTEKGVSDLAQHFLSRANISCLRRVRKTDANRLAKVTGATIVNRTEEAMSQDVGNNCGLFEVRKIGDEYYSYFVNCKDPKACSIVLRGSSKDVLNEMERNLHDAMNVCRNILLDGKLLPGGGASELEVSTVLSRKLEEKTGLKRWAYRTAAKAFEVIPRTLAQNCGANPVKVVTELLSLHASGESNMGIDGETGEVCNVMKRKIYDTFAVKSQVFKSAIEAACMLLRIDIIVSGIGKRGEPGADEKVAINEEALEA